MATILSRSQFNLFKNTESTAIN